MTKTMTVRGVKVRTASMRRFVVVACRPADFEGRRWDCRTQTYVPDTYKAFKPTIIARSDTYATARKRAEKYGSNPGGWVVVVDTVTGEEVT